MMLTLVLALSISAEPQQIFTVENKCAQTFVVSNKVSSSNCNTCTNCGTGCVDNCDNGRCQITQIVNRVGDYEYKDHVVSWNGVRINDTDAGIGVRRFGDGSKVYNIDTRTSTIYLNGERYSLVGAYRFNNPKQDELSSWYAFTGPCKLTIKDGAYYFESLTGPELERWLQHGDEVLKTMTPEQRKHHERSDLVYSWYNPRLKTMSDCRKAWAEWDRTHPSGWDGNPPKNVIRTTNSVTPPIIQYKAATNVGDGHTHTCANGHTWSHATNPTHNCQICGLPQYTQDSSRRNVTPPTVYSIPSISQQSYGDVFQSASPCANGKCQTYSPASVSNGGWYPGKNLRGR